MYGQNAAVFANNGMAYHDSELRPVSAFIGGIFKKEKKICKAFYTRIYNYSGNVYLKYKRWKKKK